MDVSIIQDRGVLRFGASTYRVSVSENREPNTEITRVTANPAVSTRVPRSQKSFKVCNPQ